MLKEFKEGRRYLICNIDEPYAEAVYSVIKCGQMAKGLDAWPEGDISFKEWINLTWKNEKKDYANKTDDILAKCMEVISAFIFLAPKWGSALDAVTLHEADHLYKDIEIILEDRKKDQSGFSELKPGIYVKD